MAPSQRRHSCNHSNSRSPTSGENQRQHRTTDDMMGTATISSSASSSTSTTARHRHGRRSARGLNALGVLLSVIAVLAPLHFAGVRCQVIAANVARCGPPAVPLNAKVKTTLDATTQTPTEAHYECDSGYELFGPATVRCDPKRGSWERELPFCGTNVAFRKPVNQSSATRAGPAAFANDGRRGNENPDAQECSETQKETSPWWRVDLLTAQTVRVVRITTRGCCGHQPIQDLEIRVGNSSVDLQKNPLCAWYPGTVDEGTTKTFQCARPLIGQFVAIQLVGVEGSLSLCEVEVFSNDEFASERCTSPGLNADTVLATFSRTCYEFHITRGETFERARATCQTNGGDLIHGFRGAAHDFILSELERRKAELRTQLVWIGAQKEPGYTARVWKWVDGEVVLKPAWGKDQPNNYNGEQNCVVLDGGRNWLWNDVGCNLDYLHYVCQHNPLSCGSPDSHANTTVSGSRQNHTIGGSVQYSCPVGHALVGPETRTCQSSGLWSEAAPTCKYIDCERLPELDHGTIRLSEERTTFGVQATYTCHENYTLIGNENRTCDRTGKWTGDRAQCLVDWCPEPPPIAGGTQTLSGKRAGSTVTYGCASGYVLIGEAILSCGLGGEWTGKPPSCRFVDCGSPARPDRGAVRLLNDTTTVGSWVRYHCDDDYWLVGPAELECTKEGKWSGDAPVCELITCETPHVPPGSYVIGYDYNVHSTIEYHCDPGHLLRGQASHRCSDTGEWTGETPFCEYIDCGALPPIPHGTMRYAQNNTYVGAEALYACTGTHKLVGSASRLCEETGKWSDAQPRCEEIRCSEPQLAEHSILSVTGNDRMYGRTLIRTVESSSSSVQTYKIGALAKYRCERGYKIVGDPLVTCEETGFWSGMLPECIYVDCQDPAPLRNGKATLSTNATYYGAAVLYECDANFRMDGPSRRICLEDGTWGHEAPVCKQITCGTPDLNIDLQLVADAIEDNSVADERSVGFVARFQCARGRTLMGNATRTCLASGHWTGRSPHCEPVDCGRPDSIENGRVIVINETTLYGGAAEYHCVPGFVRIGPYLRKCMDDGVWSGSEPRCELLANEAQEGGGLGTGIAIGAAVIVILLVLIGLVVLHRNKARPVKNTENVQAAERKEDQNAAVMSYSSLEAAAVAGRRDMGRNGGGGPATFNTFHPSGSRSTENIYDQIPSEAFYDAPYEMRSNDEVYEPEPVTASSTITINGISVR